MIDGLIVSSMVPGEMIDMVISRIEKLEYESSKTFKLGYKFEEYEQAYEELTKNLMQNKLRDEGMLKKFENNLQSVECSKEEKIIAEILNLCQDLDVAHFFRDRSTRTAYLFLNFMLMYHGFIPTMLDNPNHLEFINIKSLVCKVIEGQQIALSLLLSVEDKKKEISFTVISPKNKIDISQK